MHAVVVGGGITGLTSAYVLANAGVRTTLLEASDRLGGKVRTHAADGFVVEEGPDSFIAVRPAAAQLCRELGLGADLVGTKEPRAVSVLSERGLVPMPDGLALVLPTKFVPFATTRLFSWPEKMRMGLDLFLPRGPMDGDETIGGLLRRRLGGALVDRLAGPLVGGIYGTSIDELSLLAVIPSLRESERVHRSLLLASIAEARERKAKEEERAAERTRAAEAAAASGATLGPAAPRSVFLSLRGGMTRMTDALADTLGRSPIVDIRLGVSAVTLERTGDSYRLRLSDGSTVDCDAVVLASPAPAAAGIVEGAAPDAAAALRTIRYGSATIVSLAYRAGQFPRPVAGHGYVVAADAASPLSACTITSGKWPGRAPDGTVLLRAFLRTEGDGAVPGSASDAETIAAARAAIERTLAPAGDPLFARVARWDGAMPRYTVGHLARVAAAEDALASLPGVVLAGAAYRGVGLPDCVVQARAAAARVLATASGVLAAA
jgi:protoporphyrinogen/coproporphyrinogen III oxidase